MSTHLSKVQIKITHPTENTYHTFIIDDESIRKQVIMHFQSQCTDLNKLCDKRVSVLDFISNHIMKSCKCFLLNDNAVAIPWLCLKASICLLLLALTSKPGSFTCTFSLHWLYDAHSFLSKTLFAQEWKAVGQD